MQKIVRRLLRIAIRLMGFSILSTLVAAAIIAVRHKLDTPQRLDSALLAGEDHIYRWKWGHIFYKALGAMDAPPLVLLHTPGIGASAYEMRSIIEPLAQRYRVYAPDLLGFGLSDRPQIDYSAETYISLCRDFLREVVARPAMLLASRLSCNYAVAVAASIPELCERLVLISPVMLFEGTSEESLTLSRPENMAGDTAPILDRHKAPAQPPNHPLSLRRIVQASLEAPFVKSLLYAVLSTRLAYRVLDRGMGHNSKAARDYFYATTHQFGAQHAPMALLAGKLAHNASHEFEGVHQPTLIIWGAYALNNARSIASQQHLSARTQMVLLQDVGINVHEEQPDGVVANIREWSEEGITEASEVVKENSTPIPEAETPTDAGPVIEAYCIKCKKKTEVRNPHEVTMKNGRVAVQGTCSECGTNIYRIGKLAPQGSKNT